MMNKNRFFNGHKILQVSAVLILVSNIVIAHATVESKFNLSASPKNISGWINVFGDPKTAVRTASDTSTGFGLRSITANWNNANGNNAWDGYGQLVDDGGGFAMPSGVVANYWYNTSSIFSSGKYHVQVFGLNPLKKYSLTLMGSRGATGGATAPRSTDYNIKGALVLPVKTLDSWQNSSRKTVFTSVQPDSSGTINIAVNKKVSGGGNFGYLGGVIITEEGGSASVNTPPIVNAGLDQTLSLPVSTVSLVGSATDTEGIAGYVWSEDSSNSATIISPTNATTLVKDLSPGTYTFRLTATDTQGVTGQDTVVITILPHTASACSAKTVVVIGSSTSAGYGLNPISDSYANRFGTYLDTLNSAHSVINIAVSGYTSYHLLPTGTTIPNGRPTPDVNANITKALSYNPHAIILNLPSNDVANGIPNTEQQINLQTIISTAQSAGVPIWITTTQPRNLNAAGIAQQIAMRDWILATYGDRSINFWDTMATGGGTIDPLYDQGDGIHLNNVAHKKLFTRVANSSLITTMCDTVPVPNTAPTADAGNDQTITLPVASLTLSGLAVDSDGSIASYAWTKISGGSATITSASSASTTVTELAQGSYVFRLTVTDNQGATTTDDVAVTVLPAPVQNTPPTISSLSSVVTMITLNASALDTDGSISGYSWSVVSGPNTPTITNPSVATTTVTNLLSGTYVFQLTITDNLGATTSANLQVSL